MRGITRAGAVGLLLASACVGCASVRAEHAKRVGAAGALWAKATDAALRLAEETSVDADSARVLSEGQGLSREARREVLDRHAGVSAPVADLERLRRHARLLARYFDRLRDLSDDATDAAAEDATAKAADAAIALGRELSDSKLLTATERDALARTTRLAFRGVRERVLARELELRGDAIGRELHLQQLLLEAVRRQVHADAASISELGLARDVVRPYVEGSVSDPRGWTALRRGYLLPPEPSEILAEAGDTASRLRSAWTALAEGRFDAAAWSALAADADTLASWVRLLREVRR